MYRMRGAGANPYKKMKMHAEATKKNDGDDDDDDDGLESVDEKVENEAEIVNESINGPTLRNRNLLASLPSDIFVYKVLPFLEDGDVMDCLESCKELYYGRMSRYRIKNAIEIKSLYSRPAFLYNKGNLPRPRISRGRICGFKSLAESLLKHSSITPGSNQLGYKSLVADEEVEVAEFRNGLQFEGKSGQYNDPIRGDFQVAPNDDQRVAHTESGSNIVRIRKKHEIWQDVVNCNDSGIDLGNKYNFQILPRAEFISLEDVYISTYTLITTPYFPPNLKHLSYNAVYGGDAIFKPGIFPENLLTLHILVSRIDPLIVEPNAFPKGLKSLILNAHVIFSDPESSDNFPPMLEYLSIYEDSKKTTVFSKGVPLSLKSLELKAIGVRVTNLLPPKLTALKLQLHHADLHVGDLPRTLHTLVVKAWGKGYPLIRLLPGLLPPTLRYAEFDALENRILERNLLPEGLMEFHIEHGDITFATGSLPSSLRTLRLPDRFEKPLSTMSEVLNTLPNLSALIFQHLRANCEISSAVIPPSVKLIRLAIDDDLTNYNGIRTLSIERLEIEQGGDAGTTSTPVPVGFFSPTLKEIRLLCRINNRLLPSSLPAALLKLELIYYKYPLFKDVLPSSLTSLALSGNYPPLLKLPRGLENLYIDPYSDSVAFIRSHRAYIPEDTEIHFTSPNGFPYRRASRRIK